MAQIRVLNIDSDLHKEFKMFCAKHGISMSRKIIQMIVKEVAKDRGIGDQQVLTREEIDKLIQATKDLENVQDALGAVDVGNVLSQKEIDDLLQSIPPEAGQKKDKSGKP
jgi:antitoxin component of RelBE/YafQ-DinJ toxin-antitoxin module